MPDLEQATADLPEMTVGQPLTRPDDAPPPDEREVVFDVKDLSVSYGRVKALADVSLQIRRNFVTAFIGPSGCGKSTFIR